MIFKASHSTKSSTLIAWLLSIAILLSFCLIGCSQGNDSAPTSNETTSSSLETESSAFLENESTPTEDPLELNHRAAQTFISKTAIQYGAVGVQVAVIDNGEVVDSFAYGWATKNTDPMTTDHKFRSASISKVVLGMATMLLQEDGVIDLDANIGTCWGVTAQNPYYPNSPITIRRILSHTSSLIDHEDFITDYYSIQSRLTSSYTNTRPGSMDSYYYNNYAFMVLGATLEVASDQCVDSLLQEKLFEPLDIDASYASGDIEATDMLVTLYRENGEIGRSVEAQQSVHLSDTPGENADYFAGGLTISANDLAKIVALLASDGVYDGQQLLEASSIEIMETCLSKALPDGSYQAHPLFYANDLYGRDGIYYHSAYAYGAYNCISYDPETGDGVVVLTTGASEATDHYDISNICDEINAYIYPLI